MRILEKSRVSIQIDIVSLSSLEIILDRAVSSLEASERSGVLGGSGRIATSEAVRLLNEVRELELIGKGGP